MRFFPLVPSSAPPDDFARYLALYNAQAEGLLASYGANVHPEWDINVPAPVMRSGAGLSGLRGTQAETRRPNGRLVSGYHYPGELAKTQVETRRPNGELARTLVSHLTMLDSGFAAVGAPLGPSPDSSFPSTGIAKVSTTWAQRAINAAYASIGVARRVVVDGVSGPQTLEALKDVRVRYLATYPQPAPQDTRTAAMPTIADRTHMTLAGNLYDDLAGLNQVIDPTTPTHETDSGTVPDWGTTAGPCPAGMTQGADGFCRGPNTAVAVGLVVALGLGAWYLSRRR